MCSIKANKMPRQRNPTTSSHKSSGCNPNWKMLLIPLLLVPLPAISASLPAIFCHCTTYECYFYLKIVPVALSTLSVVLLAFILLMKVLCSKCECIRNTKVVKWYWDKASSLTEVVFKHFLIEDDNNRKVFDAFGYKASHENMQRMSIILLQAIVLALGQLWDEFLIQESYICSSTDPRLHCFSTSTNQKLNCQNLSENETFVTCYKYVFNTGHAAASAIGIISATGLIVYIVGLVSLKLFNGISCRKLLSIILCLIVIIEILAFATVLGYLQQQRIIGLLKMIGMGIMISSTCIVFTMDEFSKIKKARVKPNNRK